MKIAVPREIRAEETRVALDPESCKKLIALDLEVAVETGAGISACFPDQAYQDAGATLMPDSATLLGGADFVLKVNAPQARPDGNHEVDLIRPGALLLASLFPTRHLDAVQRMAARNLTAFSTDCIPRTTRAQAMDTLSSQANIVGYKGVLLGAMELPKYFPMFITAAGTTLPAKVFVIGAGVAGLQAIATAKRLGASVTATDVRPEVKEQIESVGGKVRGHRSQTGRLRRRRLRHGTLRRGQGPASEDAGGPLRPGGRGHHHRPHRRRLRTQAAGRNHREQHEARFGHRGPRGRRGRQLHPVEAGHHRIGGGCEDPRAAQSSGHSGDPRQHDVLAQPAELHDGLLG